MNLLWKKPVSTEDIWSTGILNQWYLVCRSEDVGTTPVGLTRLNRKIALWRDGSGTVHAIDDFCPHRGAPMSKGVVVENGLACKYHGVVVNGQGVVQVVPPVHDCPMVRQKKNIGYPVQEKFGAIWLYFSDGIDDKVPEMELPPQMTSPEWSGFLFTQVWNCNYRVALDNRLDPIHGSYLHMDTFTLVYGTKQSLIELETTERGFIIQRDTQRGVNIDRTEVVYKPGSNYWVATEIPYPKSAGGNFFRIMAYPTPIDAERTYVWFFRYQRSDGWRRDLWRFLYKNRLDARHNYVAGQDRDMLEAIPKDAREREQLIQTDIGVARIRRMQKLEAEAQANRINEHFKLNRAAQG
jgi:phenylpropionate dioxygenase-like ring-hydroxylating dioxygenase large terminal subunit